jgi:hypothetical protein
MRHTEFWSHMERVLGEGYSRVWATQHVLAPLEGRTVDQALADGVPPKRVWRVVAESLDLPESQR